MSKLLEYRYNGRTYSTEGVAQDAATQRLSGFTEEIKEAYSVSTVTRELHDEFLLDRKPNLIIKTTTHVPEDGGISNGTALVEITTTANFSF
tara:strand:- start:292 stop:567 length:276 start_codon:yes stop_codon:yes gene_type:complete